LIPYKSVVVLPEVAQQPLCGQLAAVASLSGNAVAMVVHDCIPVGSADTVPPAESERFTKYLAIVKAATVISGVSQTATAEFHGFVNAVQAQGLPGPRVINVSLPVDAPDVTTVAEHLGGEAPSQTADEPLVLVVGSHEPRKNHDAIMFAAERLWDEGLRFRLRFIGGGSTRVVRRFDRRARALADRGRPIEIWRSANDDELVASYRAARFTVFPSLHEGFGLPVAESLALAVPVVTSNYGSTAEIARDGGCLLVDPRSDDAIVTAMRELLTDDDLYARLLAECLARTPRTWGDYADELWTGAVAPLLEARP
jgi:glycosyltransferase involved in cell wall biosynthesis